MGILFEGFLFLNYEQSIIFILMQNTPMNLKMLFGHLGHEDGELLGIWSLIQGIRTIRCLRLKKKKKPFRS